MGLPYRRTIRLRDFDYSSNNSYFVTICTQDRECLFGKCEPGAAVGAPREAPALPESAIMPEIKFIPNEFGEIIEKYWKWLSEKYEYVDLGPYVVMPNHFHGIVIIDKTGGRSESGASRGAPTNANATDTHVTKTLGQLIGAFKTVSAKHINLLRKTQGLLVWQRNYYEHIIRNEEEYARICEYIHLNPEQWLKDENYRP